MLDNNHMTRTISLIEAVPYLRAYANQIFVVKVGGELMEDPELLNFMARDIAILHRLQIKVVVVHGGGPQLDRLTKQLGNEVTRVAGRRVTSPEVLDAAKMVFRGQLSLELVAALTKHGERAVGLCGADGVLVRADKRPTVLVTSDSGEKIDVDYGEVGDVKAVNPDVIHSILETGAIPVISPLASDETGRILNVNADTMAVEIAIAVKASKCLLCTNVPGILADINDSTSLLHYTDLAELDELDERGAFSEGMRPKVAAIARAIEGGVPRVHVVQSSRVGAIIEEVFTTDGCGTLVVRSKGETAPEDLVLHK